MDYRRQKAGKDQGIVLSIAPEAAQEAPLKAQWKSLFGFTTRRHLLVLVPAILAAILAGALIPAQAYLLGRIFALFGKFGIGSLSDQDFQHHIREKLIWLALLGAGAWLVNGAFFMLWATFGELQTDSARHFSFRALEGRDSAWYDLVPDGITTLTNAILSYVDDMQHATSLSMGGVIRDLSTLLIAYIMALALSWKLTLVTAALIPMLVWIISVVSKKIHPNTEAQKKALHLASGRASTALTAIDAVKANNGQDQEVFSYAKLIAKASLFFRNQVHWNAAQSSVSKAGVLLMFVQGFWFGSTLVDKISGGAATVFTVFWSILLGTNAAMQIIPQIIPLEKGKLAGTKLRNLLDSRNGRLGRDTGPIWPICELGGSIIFNEVVFSYPSNPDKTVLKAISATCFPKQLTFIVGTSGSGKSTLGQLVMKLYEPAAGMVGLGTINVKDMRNDYVRKTCHLVEQHSVVFNTTIAENIALGALSQVTMEDIRRAATQAQIIDDIEAMPNGFQTVVGARGGELSGGQRQRIALARAFIRDSEFLILDESTSALDPTTRENLMWSIRRIREDRHTVIITHDVSCIHPKDNVIVMEDGHVVGYGLRFQLLNNAAFCRLLLAYPRAAAREPTIPERKCSIQPPKTPERQSARASTLVPSMFTNRIGVTPERNSAAVPSIVSPLWSTLPRSAGLSHRPMSLFPPLSSEPETPTPAERRKSRTVPHSTGKGKGKAPLRPSDEEPMISEEIDLQDMKSFEDDKDSAKATPALKPLPLHAILRSIWPVLTPWGRTVGIFGLFMSLVFAAMTSIFAFVFSKLLTTLYDPRDRKQKALKWSLAIIGIGVSDGLSLYLCTTAMQYCGQLWVNRIRELALWHLLEQPREFFEKEDNAVSSLVSCLDAHGEHMEEIVGRYLSSNLVIVVMISTAVIWSLVSCWKLTLVLLSCAPLPVLTTMGMKWIAQKMNGRHADVENKAHAKFTEAVTSMKTIRILTLEYHFRNEYSKAAQEVLKVGIKRALSMGIFHGMSTSTVPYISAILFHYGSVLLLKREFELSKILQVFTQLLMAMSNASMVAANLPNLSLAIDSATRLLRLAHLPSPTPEHDGLAQPSSATPIEFRDVSFAYPSRPAHPVLRSFNLTINAGDFIAIVGTSGCGKSTLAALLVKLYTLAPDGGAILVAHRNVQHLDTRTLRAQIALVPQSPTLFAGSVVDNILYGLPRAAHAYTYIDAMRAASLAGIHEYIMQLPAGYDTPIGDGGIGLSGGQLQRLAIARALARNPQVLVLDEATSALDAATAAELRAVLYGLIRGVGMTVVAVTHDRGMMRGADRVAVLDKGELVEVGSYEELVDEGGVFARLIGESRTRSASDVSGRAVLGGVRETPNERRRRVRGVDV
ncbi:P-loop containing nucleoside triphosphate hydrolase protein [Trichodelitschia bisporula]|uniref:P-loop containing nucleoside triphosphate hydrolase protein n=1 Tax=Trichodelitschia bisporula TaxID=703511 RepID=A0A6G1I3J5_9PEZI|nr:P-loop containing nucleoside triphosphate hydrolase protein [Trichodelitschia bisporula]